MQVIRTSIPRKEGPDKVTGAAKYVDDFAAPEMLYAQLVTSTKAHALIRKVDISGAWAVPGVLGVMTGNATDLLCGPILQDRPPLARDRVRHFGEPVAIIIATSEEAAWKGVDAVTVDYEPLPVVNSPRAALAEGAPLVHERLGEYKQKESVYPVPGTNIANHTKIRKGDMARGWADSAVTIECSYSLPQSAHAFMETRSARAEVKPDGQVIIHSATQGPHFIKKSLSSLFKIDEGKLTVIAPLVGGAYGGKTPDQLEILVLLASQAVGGRLVRLTNSREQDMTASPCHIGLEATVKLGCTAEGKLTAAELQYLYDGGAYADTGPQMSRAGAVQGTGPYRIPNVHCDSYCVYTNHTYTTAFRGFGHTEFTFAIERTIDQLARRASIDPIEFRIRNALATADLTPTEVVLNQSNIGDVAACLQNLRNACRWEEGQRQEMPDGKIRAKGIGCHWKSSSSPTNAASGAIITFNHNGSINLNVGLVDIGQGTKTTLAQLLAEKFKTKVDNVHVAMTVDTRFSPEHWKTVASMGVYMVGRAVLEAADDAIQQLCNLAAMALHSAPGDLEVGDGNVYQRDDPTVFIEIKKIAHGYKHNSGHSVGGPVIGRGAFIMRHLTSLDEKTGAGRPGPYWTVGAEAIEVEFDPRDCSYTLLNAWSVIDAGNILNPMAARYQVMGAMSMGLGLGTRERFTHSSEGIMQLPRFRTYELLRFGEQPQYNVGFVETPLLDGPYGARGIGEHGIVGTPAALANSLSLAAGVELNQLPLLPETIWRARKELPDDTL